MADTTIKSFLIKLGYKTDESSIKKFEDGIVHATKIVVGFAAAVEATAVAVAVGVGRFANNLEALYFASVRTGSAAGNLKAFDRAAQSFGASAGQALGSAEALARFFRQNPAGSSYVNALLGQIGESAYDKSGKLKEIPELITTIGKLFASNTKHNAGFVNYQLSDMLHIDEKTMLAIQDGSFARRYAEVQKQINTPAFKHATEGAHAFMESLRRLQDQLYILGVQITDTLQKKLSFSLDGITRWLSSGGDQKVANIIIEIVGTAIDDFNKLLAWWDEHHEAIETRIKETWDSLKKAYTDIIKPTFIWVYDKLKDLDTQTGGWSTKLLVLTGLLSKMGLPATISALGAIAMAFNDMGKGLEGMGDGAKTLGVVATAIVAIAGSAVALAGLGVEIGAWFNDKFPNNPLAKLGNWIGGALFEHDNPLSLQNRLDKYGLKPTEKAAIMANIFAESRGNPIATSRDDKGNTHFGLFQFGPEWQEKYTEWADTKNAAGAHYNRFLSRSDDPAEQIDFFMDMLQGSNDPGMRRLRAVMQANRANGAMGANKIAQTMALEFERPFAGDKGTEEANKRGTGATVIYNSFHITESNDPHKTANAVKEIIDKTHRDAARDFVPSGVIQ